MKKAILFAAGVFTLCVTLWATNQVSSVNVAGYMKFDVERGKNYLLRYDFFTMGTGDCTVINVLGKQMPQNTKVYIWTAGGGGSYVIEEYKRYFSSGWKTNWVPGTNLLDVGAGFWISVPAAAPQPSYALNLLGEVPNNPTSVVPVSLRYNLLGYSYPAQIAWTNTDLAKNPTQGDKLYYWNGTGYDLVEYKRYFSGGWKTNWVGPNVTIGVGKGFWFYKAAAGPMSWTETRPYNLD